MKDALFVRDAAQTLEDAGCPKMASRLTALADLLDGGVIVPRKDAESAQFLFAQEAWRCQDTDPTISADYTGAEARIRAMLTASEAK